MMRHFQITFIFFLQVFFFTAAAQQKERQFYVSGIIVNKETKEPVPFANIAIKDAYKGTASNAVGEFAFRTDSLPLVLVVTHVSFETRLIEIRKEYDRLEIELVPGKLLMDELVVKAKGNDQYAYDLVRRAYYKVIGKGSAQHYGKAFYRQISKNGDDYSELYEIFYDTKYSNNGVEDWAIQEGRYALKLSTIDSFIYNKNFTMLVRLLTVVQPSTDDLVMPVSEKVEEQFYLKTEDVTSVNNRRLARISFEVMETVTTPAMEGELLIDTESTDILRITGTIANDNLNFITLKGERGSWKNYKVSCEIAFKPTEDHLALDYLSLGQNFEYYQDNIFINHVETRALFTYYEYYEPPKKKRLGGRLMRFGQRDSDMLDAIGYNQLFWDENIIVKRTPIEAEVIASFEKERAFGSIYLNNKNQVELEDYIIDNDPFIVSVRQNLKEYVLPRHGEKVFIHHDRSAYVSGQRIWWKAYIVNMANNLKEEDTGTLYLSLKDPTGKNIARKMVKIQGGMAEGDLEIPPNLSSGIYALCANTALMTGLDDRFAFTEKLPILNPGDDTGMLKLAKKDSLKTLLIQPEGGAMVVDFPVQLAFVAIDETGQPTDFRGRITDDQGRQVAQLKTDYNGFGSTFIQPTKDSKYKLEIPDGYKTPSFPAISTTGYTIMINNLKPNAIDVLVRGTMKFEGRKFYLLFVSNGTLFDRRIGVLLKGMYRSEIPKANFPNGIAQVILVDDTGLIHCRRMIFLEQPHEANINYYLASKEFTPRERIEMVLELNDENGKPINGADLSVSIVNKDKSEENDKAQNIRSFFDFGYLFDYELPAPAELLAKGDRESLKNFEFLMLNQRTALPEIKSFQPTEKPEKSKIDIPAHSQIQGHAQIVSTGEPLAHGYLNLVAYPDPAMGTWFVQTNDDGSFYLNDIDFPDSLSIHVFAWNNAGNPIVVNINGAAMEDTLPVEVVNIPITANQKKLLDSYNNSIRLGYKESDNAQQTAMQTGTNRLIYGRIDQRIVPSARNSQEEVLRDYFSGREAGTDITEQGRIMLRGDAVEPLIILNGFLLNPSALSEKATEFFNKFHEEKLYNDALKSLTVQQVERIEIVKKAAKIDIYGVEWNHGIIAIYIRDKELLSKFTNSESIRSTILGFSGLTTYSAPDYSKASPTGSDLRATVYWNPQLKVNKRGRVKISFYNTDDAKTLQICVQGVTNTGLPVYQLFDIGKNAQRTR